MKKQLLTVIITVGITLSMGSIAFAGQWIQDENGWWYDNGNNTYPLECWQWIDGNQDGIAECYYFDKNGYCLLDTMTPDGYLADETGTWIFNKTRQAKVITAEGEEKVATEDIINLTEMQLEKLKYLIQPLGEVDTNFMQTSVMNWDKETILPLVYRYLDIWAIKEADIGILPVWEDMSGPQILAYYDEGKVDLLMQSAFGRIWELPFSQGDIPVYKNGKSVVWVGTDPDVCNLEIDKIYQKDRSLYVEGSAFNIYTDGTKISKGRFRVKLDENSSSVFGYTIISISRL